MVWTDSQDYGADEILCITWIMLFWQNQSVNARNYNSFRGHPQLFQPAYFPKPHHTWEGQRPRCPQPPKIKLSQKYHNNVSRFSFFQGSHPRSLQTGELLAGVGLYKNIIRAMTPIATANYDFESLIKGGYVYGRVLLGAQCALRILRNFLHWFAQRYMV